jgi:hypothetical protein
MLYARLMKTPDNTKMTWLWLVLLLVPVVLYVVMNYSKVKVAKKSCSSCPYKKASLEQE